MRYKTTKLDYSLKTSKERIDLVNEIINTTDPANLRSTYLSCMSDYILFVNDRQRTKKERTQEEKVLTRNREKTISKRETSYEEIVSKLENGEDGFYAMISDNKNQILDPKDPITEEDLKKFPALQEQMDIIEKLQRQLSKATGIKRYSLKKQIIETWQQIYILKASLKEAPAKGKISNQIKTLAHMELPEHVTLNENNMPYSDCIISLFNPEHVSFLLHYYSQLKEDSYDFLDSDMHWLLIDLEDITERALKQKYPLLYDIIVWKVDGRTNEEIKELAFQQYGVSHSIQYFSTLWRNRIPKLIAEQAQKDWLVWYYNHQGNGKWIKCGRCGHYKPAHPLFFSANNNSTGFYSICKSCRNK